MSTFDNFTTDELRTRWDNIVSEIDYLEDQKQAVPQDLFDQEISVAREISRREAEESRQAGGYSVVFFVDNEEVEYALASDSESDAHAEAERGAKSMHVITGANVTVERINGPITE